MNIARVLPLALGWCLAAGTRLFASTPTEAADLLSQAASAAVSTNAEAARIAIQTLRDAGPEGLDALFRIHKLGSMSVLNTQRSFTISTTSLSPEQARLRFAMESVAQQRDCNYSHLYWYTDLGKAREAARAAGKPILSLRLLGNLNEEYSCANSRFFRTTVYANQEVAQYLRDHFILHWQSERPVPRITIDFGDGRKIERTITGNSIHYVLDGEGRPLDALPGLYSSKAFIKGLDQAIGIWKEIAGLNELQRDTKLRNYHRARAKGIRAEWDEDLAKIGINPGELPGAKMPGYQLSDEAWTKIAALHPDNVRLDDAARSLALSKQNTAAAGRRLTVSKSRVESPMVNALRSLENSIAEDTVRNEYSLHSQIHDWLANGPMTLDALNTRVYNDLFLTPRSDPWLGLAPANALTALEGGGLTQ